MKPVYALLLLLVLGCNSTNNSKIENDESINKIDSIINQSKQNYILLDQASRESDSSITQKVEKTVQKIGKLETEVKQLKAENRELKEKLNDANDDGSNYRIRAISDN